MKVKAIPEGYHTITPYFSVRDANKLIQFFRQAFDAEEKEIHSNEDGTIINAEMKIGDSIVMIGEAPKDLGERKLMTSMLYMYVNDADAVFKKAIQSGGKSIMQPADQFYGDRSGAVEDPAGNQWWIATHKEEMSREELIKRASQRGK